MLANQLQFGDSVVIDLTAVRPERMPSWLGTGRPGRGDPEARAPEVILERPRRPGSANRIVVRPARKPGADAVEATTTDADMLGRVLSGGPFVAWLVGTRSTSGGGYLLAVQCHMFAPPDGLPDRLEIGYGDLVVDLIRGDPAGGGGRTDIATFLADEFLLPPLPGEPARRLVYRSGPDERSDAPPTAFTMFGRRWVADVRLRDGRAEISRMTGIAQRRDAGWKRLAGSLISFVDVTRQAVLSQQLQAQLVGLTEQGQSYLDLWDEYNTVERDYLVMRARDFGFGTYLACQPVGKDVWRFTLDADGHSVAFLRNLSRTEEQELELEASEQLPPELGSGDDAKGGTRSRTWMGALAAAPHVDDRTVDLRAPDRRDADDNAPPRTGRLFLALSGSRIQLNRRERARDRIAHGRAELPGLALLLEGVAFDPPPVQQYELSKLLTKAVRACFGGEPTEAQRQALLYAVNTPDIVLVQGPPGTGKTQFIAALQQCLSDLDGRALAIGNKTLLTSYQHDAVDNVTRKTRTRDGLPTLKVDSRQRGTKENIQRWCEEVVAALDEQIDQHRPQARRRERLNSLRSHAASYDESPHSPQELLGLLAEIERIPDGELSLPLRQRGAALRIDTEASIAARRRDYEPRRARMARAVRALRAAPDAFADDGPDRARMALRELAADDLLDDADRALLARAAVATALADAWLAGGGSEDPALSKLVAELAALRARLLDRLAPGGPVAVKPARDPEVLRLLHEIADEYEAGLRQSTDGIDVVLANYRQDLVTDPDYVQRTLRDYSGVLAATCQQVDSQEMFRLLDAPLPMFGTVIIDEAARVNPLDLMIPMVCARRRIALVGDHKQLPHALDMQIQRELDKKLRAGNGAEAAADVGRSLFERWYGMFGRKRSPVRTIRLNEQFRMHPTLGKFVSRVFYGSENAIKPHPSTRALTHDLGNGYRGKVAMWVDVPRGAYEREQRHGHSYYRPAEADRLAGVLAELAELDPERALSFGVITFYKAQSSQLWESLAGVGLAIPDDDTEDERYVPDRQMLRTRDGRERLRVGTVDAFQGMEFDVVLLSVTRSNRPRPNGAADGRFGHLLSENRMCVAMSRQRRLLIAVGDQNMADRATTPTLPGPHSPPRSVVEGLVAFRELCDGPEGSVVRS